MAGQVDTEQAGTLRKEDQETDSDRNQSGHDKLISHYWKAGQSQQKRHEAKHRAAAFAIEVVIDSSPTFQQERDADAKSLVDSARPHEEVVESTKAGTESGAHASQVQAAQAADS